MVFLHHRPPSGGRANAGTKGEPMPTNNRPSAREVRDLVLSDRCAARGAWGVLNDMRERLRAEAGVRGYDDPWLDAEWRSGETGNTNFDRMASGVSASTTCGPSGKAMWHTIPWMAIPPTAR